MRTEKSDEQKRLSRREKVKARNMLKGSKFILTLKLVKTQEQGQAATEGKVFRKHYYKIEEVNKEAEERYNALLKENKLRSLQT